MLRVSTTDLIGAKLEKIASLGPLSAQLARTEQKDPKASLKTLN